MPSFALRDWSDKRAKALDSLDDVHGKVTGRRVGRQYATKHYNLTMYVALAAEFQGFCRDLHDETASALVTFLPAAAGPLAPIYLNALTRSRALDRANAQPKSLGSDFQTLGIALWSELATANPKQKKRWHDSLDHLNEIRNAVAHSNEDNLRKLHETEPLTVKQWRRKRATLNRLAAAMDVLAYEHVQDLTGEAPW